MKVTLAYPYTDAEGVEHAPDKTITVDDEIGRVLVHDGRARKADPGTPPSRAPRKAAKAPKRRATTTPAAPAAVTTPTTSEEG